MFKIFNLKVLCIMISTQNDIIVSYILIQMCDKQKDTEDGQILTETFAKLS